MVEISVSSPSSYSCGICQSELYNPKILKCFRVFCRRCLDQVSDSRLLQWSKRITCPLCESVTYITWKGIDELDDFKYLDQSKNEQSKSQCEMCDKNNIAASKCEDCQEFMCKECHDYHKMHKKFKSHTVVSLDTQDIKTVLKDDVCMQVATIENMCKEHYVPHPIQEFCKACSKPVCAFCMSGSHKGHDTEKFQTTVVNARTSLQVASKALESKLPFLESLLNEAYLEKAKYNNHIKNTRAEIQETSERLKQEICRKIDGITRENISKLDSMEQADNAVLESYRKDVARSKMTIDGLLYMTENLLKFGDKNDLIEAFIELQTRLYHYGHNYGVIMPDIFEPLMKPGSIKLNELYEAVGSIERDKKPMTNSFIAFKQQPSSHLVDNDKAFTKIHSFNLGHSVDSVVCTFNTEVVLVLQGVNLYFLSVHGLFEHFCMLGCGKVQVIPVGYTRDRIYFSLSNQIKSSDIFIFCQNSKEVKKLDIKVAFHHACKINDNTLLLLNRSKFTFYEINNEGNVNTTFYSEFMAENPTCFTHINCMRVTTISRIIISTNHSLYTFTFTGRLEQVFRDENSIFRQICEDRRGNLFVANRDRVCLFTPYGHFIGEVLTSDISFSPSLEVIQDLSIDGCGNLWKFVSYDHRCISGVGKTSKTQIDVYSYT